MRKQLRLQGSLAGDPDAAEVAMRAHVRYAIEDIQGEIVRRFGAPLADSRG